MCIHIMGVYTTVHHPCNKSQKLGVEVLISEITGSTLDYPIPYKKVMFIFITFHLLIFQMSLYLVHKALAHRNTWPTHNNTSPVASVSNGIKQFVKCCIFGPTACCLVDYRMYSVNYFIYSYIIYGYMASDIW